MDVKLMMMMMMMMKVGGESRKTWEQCVKNDMKLLFLHL